MDLIKKEQDVVTDHRNMLQVSKNISQFQQENLKSWAFIFLDDVDTIKVSWNFFRKNKTKDFFAGKVIYDIGFKEDSELDMEKVSKGIDQIVACVKFLFWSETKVEMKIDGKKWKINS